MNTLLKLAAILACVFYGLYIVRFNLAHAEFISPAPALITIRLEDMERMEDRILYLERVQRAYKRLKRSCKR